MSHRPSLLLGVALGLCLAARPPAPAAGAPDPFLEHLRRLEARAASRPAARSNPAPAASRRAGENRLRRPQSAFRRERPATPREARRRPAPPEPVTYARKRIGRDPARGDLLVRAVGPPPVHVYLGTRLVSLGGDGAARLADLAPGKYPVLLWMPTTGRRRTWWVTIRPGLAASLSPRL